MRRSHDTFSDCAIRLVATFGLKDLINNAQQEWADQSVLLSIPKAPLSFSEYSGPIQLRKYGGVK